MAKQRANWCFHAILAQKEYRKLQWQHQPAYPTYSLALTPKTKRNEYTFRLDLFGGCLLRFV